MYRQKTEARKALARCRKSENVYLYILGKIFTIAAGELSVSMSGLESRAPPVGASRQYQLAPDGGLANRQKKYADTHQRASA